MRKIWVVLLLAPLLLVSTVAASPLYSPESLARYFRLDWQVMPGQSGPTLEGYVYNQTDLMAVRMGSILGAFWGGLTVGFVQQFSALILPPQLQNAAIFVVFLMIVLLRPQGLFGRSAERA